MVDGNETRDFQELRRLTVSGLTTPEQFVLGVCRCWDAFDAQPDPTLHWRELSPVFAYMNVIGAFCAFERAFAMLARARPVVLTFHDPDSEAMSTDEARLLSGIAHLQRGGAPSAMATLRGTLPRAAARAILPPLARIAAVLDAGGHRLPAWCGDGVSARSRLAKVRELIGRARLGDVESLRKAYTQ